MINDIMSAIIYRVYCQSGPLPTPARLGKSRAIVFAPPVRVSSILRNGIHGVMLAQGHDDEVRGRVMTLRLEDVPSGVTSLCSALQTYY